MRFNRAGWALVLAAGALLAAQNGYKLFQQGLVKERAETDLRGAIGIYEQVVQASGVDRKLAAQALFRIGECQRAMGNAEARKAYERIVRDYADQPEVVTQARERLVAMGRPAVSAPTVRRAWTLESSWNLGPVSADGRYHAYSRGGPGGLLLRDLATDTVRRIESVPDKYLVYEAVVSPDGKWIAYGVQPNRGNLELYVAGIDGSSPRSIFKTFDNNNVSWVIPSGWTPDGKEVLVNFNRDAQSNYHFGMISVETGRLRVLKEFEFGLGLVTSISPDGKWVAYTAQTSPERPEYDIHVIQTDGAGERKLVDHAADDSQPCWTPDGRGLVFLSNRRGPSDAYFLPVSGGRAGGPAAMIKDNVNDILGVTQQGTLYYLADAGTHRIRSASLDSATGRILGEAETLPLAYTGIMQSAVLSPDGQWLAYIRRRAVLDRERSLTLRSMTSGAERELRLPVKGLNSVAWYPDSKSLVIHARDMRDLHGMWKIDAATGASELLFLRKELKDQRIGFLAPFVAPDTRAFYVRGYVDRAGTTLAINPATKIAREVFRKKDVSMSRPVVSSDGRYVSSTFTNVETKRSGLLVVDAQTGEFRELCQTQKPTWWVAGWTPDDRHIVMVSTDKDQLEVWRVPFDGGEPVKSPLDARESEGFNLSPQSNGNRLVWITGKEQPEVWAADNILPGGGARQ